MISVLMPVYNVKKYLNNTLESVANQTYEDFEVIMIDDGSTDGSGDICDKWAEKDSRFKVFHEQNGGVSRARNIALSKVRGEYMFFMDSDDLILPETFEELLNALIENNADVAMGNKLYVDDNGNLIEDANSLSDLDDKIMTNIEYLSKLTKPSAIFYCTLWGKIYKSTIFDGITFPEGRIYEDEARIHEIIFKCKTIVTCKKRYYTYIKHQQSITGMAFNYSNFDKEDAYTERINFFLDKGLTGLAGDASIFALDSAVVTFTNCIDTGMYYGKAKDKLHSVFSFFIKYAPPFSSLNAFQKKVMTISRIILYFPDLYAEYVNFKFKTENMGTGAAVKDEAYELTMKCFDHLPTKDRIVFESHPELSCNTYPVYKYLLEKGINKDYEFVWLTEDKTKYKHINPSRVRFLNYSQTAKNYGEKIQYMYTIATAKALVYSNKLPGTHGKGKISLCLQHGMPLKRSSGTYCIKNKCTAAVCVSEFFADNYSKDFRVDKEKMIFTGFPRNDLLLKDNDSVEKMGYDKYDKIIFWLPTYRQRSEQTLNKNAHGFEMSVHGTGIPTLNTTDDFKTVNNFLQKNNCLLILKPHPVQDMSVTENVELSNFRIINDSDLRNNDVQLYELLGKSDALITDYSSVYYDYLLTDNPIGLTIDDIDEYIAKRGFVYNNPLDILKGEYITDKDSLLKFIENVKNGIDNTKNERTKVKNLIHSVTDGSSTERVGEYIIEQLHA